MIGIGLHVSRLGLMALDIKIILCRIDLNRDIASNLNAGVVVNSNDVGLIFKTLLQTSNYSN